MDTNKKLPIKFYKLIKEGSKEEFEVLEMLERNFLEEEFINFINGKRVYKKYDLRNLNIKERYKLIYSVLWRKKYNFYYTSIFWNIYSNTVLNDKIIKKMTCNQLCLYIWIQIFLWGISFFCLVGLIGSLITKLPGN